eukprot:3309012-Pleurochrysis_carterae.AAC.2
MHANPGNRAATSAAKHAKEQAKKRRRSGLSAHLDEAHAAVAGNREALVEAEARDIDADRLTRLEDARAVLNLHGVSVDNHLLNQRGQPMRAAYCVKPYSVCMFSGYWRLTTRLTA